MTIPCLAGGWQAHSGTWQHRKKQLKDPPEEAGSKDVEALSKRTVQDERRLTTAEAAEKERLRRARISASNVGRRAWNTGRKHSEGEITAHNFTTRD